MAIENAKLLNVRIKNKYDSYENWASSGLVLEAGEIAIAHTTVDVAVDGGIAKHPALLMKVGDGASTFAQLPWLSAKAADVLSVCKNETELTAFVNNVIANAGIATDKAMKELAGKVTTAEGAIDALEALVGTDKVADQITAAIAALNLDTTYEKVGVAKGLVDALADGAVKDNADAIAAINHAETGVLAQAKAYADGLDSAMDSRVDIVEAKLSDIDEKYTVGQVIDFEIKNVQAEIGQLGRTLGQDIVKINSKLKGFADSDYAVYNAIAAAKEAGENAQADIDALELVVAKQADVNDALALKADQTALQAEIDRAKAAEKANADAIAAIKEDVDAFFLDADMTESAKDTLKEIQTYINTDVQGAAAMTESINGVKDRVKAIEDDYLVEADKTELTNAINGKVAQGDHDALAGRVTAVEGAVATKAEQAALEEVAGKVTTLEGKVDVEKVSTAIEDAIAAQDFSGFTTDAEHEELAGKVTVNEGKIAALEAKFEGENSVDNKIDAAKQAAIDAAALDATSKADAAEAAAKTHADGLNTAMNTRVEALETNALLITDTLVFDCGNSGVTA